MDKEKLALELAAVTGHQSDIKYGRDQYSTATFTVVFYGADIDVAHQELINFVNDSFKKLNSELADKAER